MHLNHAFLSRPNYMRACAAQFVFLHIIRQHGDKLPGIGVLREPPPGDFFQQGPVARIPAACQAAPYRAADSLIRGAMLLRHQGIQPGGDRLQQGTVRPDGIYGAQYSLGPAGNPGCQGGSADASSCSGHLLVQLP